MISILNKISDIADEFGTTLNNKLMSWFYNNKNNSSQHQPNLSSIKN